MASSRGRGRSLARSAAKPVVKVKIDPARSARWKKLRVLLDVERRKEAGGYDTYWEAVGEILDAELYVAGGYATATDFLREVVKEKERTALRNVRVARYASPAEESRYGTAILDGAIGYVEAKLGIPPRGKLPIAFDKLRIAGKALDQVSLAEIRVATRSILGKKGKSKAKPASPSETAIARAFSKVKSLANLQVRVVSGMLHISPIPLHVVSDLVKALRGLSLPVDSTS